MSQINKRKVVALYRVSTKLQVKDDDIPMQRAECRSYVEAQPGWELYAERVEKGISGFKNAVQDRDALNDILALAERGEFDILLVYMSDRLGRRENDTPFYVADLGRLGIEVWSVKEGQLKTEEHIDKLLNYIRFWNAEGESLKTSVRVRDAQLEMLKRGEYTGGGCPYGYDQVYSGNCNSKGRPLKKLVVNEEEAAVVRRIYELCTDYGMGGCRIAQDLNLRGVKTKKNSKWTLCTVNNILRNPIYKGYYSYGKGKTKGKRGNTPASDWILSGHKLAELVIIEERLWDKTQKLRAARNPACVGQEAQGKTEAAANPGSHLLLLGLIYCGYCNARLSNGTAYDKWTTKDGMTHKKIRGRYKCMTRAEGGVNCSGKTAYPQEPLEAAVLEAVLLYLNQLSIRSITSDLLSAEQLMTRQEEKKLLTIRNGIRAAAADLATLKDQLPGAIRGEFALSLKELQELIGAKKQLSEQLQFSLLEKQKEYRRNQERRKTLLTSVPLSASELFCALSPAAKRQLLPCFIEKILVKKTGIELVMRISPQSLTPTHPHSTGPYNNPA